MIEAIAIAVKDLKLIVRDRAALFWMLAFPLMIAVLFGSVFGADDEAIRQPLAMLVVDQSRSATSKALIARVERSKSLEIVCPQGKTRPCSWSLAAAREAVQQGKAVAYLQIPENYRSEGLLPNAKALVVGIDPGRRMEKGVLQGLIMEATYGGLSSLFTDRDRMRKKLARSIHELEAEPSDADAQTDLLPLLRAAKSFYSSPASARQSAGLGLGKPRFETVQPAGQSEPRSPYEISFPQAIVWGMLSILAVFAPLLARERQTGTLLRLSVSPVSWTHILAGKALATLIGSMAVVTLLLVAGKLVFGVRFASLGHVALAVVSIAICFSGMMMLIATFGRTEQSVSSATWAINMPLAMFGGGMIPLFAMPSWMVHVSYLSPIRWATYALEGGIWRDLSLADMLFPSAILIGVGLASFALGAVRFSRNQVA